MQPTAQAVGKSENNKTQPSGVRESFPANFRPQYQNKPYKILIDPEKT
jgi:hypothetical protein